MRISSKVPTKSKRFKRNSKTSKIGLSVSLAVKDEGEKNAEDDSQSFLLSIMNR